MDVGSNGISAHIVFTVLLFGNLLQNNGLNGTFGLIAIVGAVVVIGGGGGGIELDDDKGGGGGGGGGIEVDYGKEGGGGGGGGGGIELEILDSGKGGGGGSADEEGCIKLFSMFFLIRSLDKELFELGSLNIFVFNEFVDVDLVKVCLLLASTLLTMSLLVVSKCNKFSSEVVEVDFDKTGLDLTTLLVIDSDGLTV